MENQQQKNQMNCTRHIQFPIISICIAPHQCQCQRKLCIDCQYEHGVDIKYTIPTHRFQDMFIKQLREFKIDQTSELTQKRKNFLMILSQTESMLKNTWQQLQESIQQIFETIEMQDEQYFKIMNDNFNPTDLSDTDLEQLVQIVQEKKLNEWKAQKDSCFQKLSKVQDLWETEIKAFNENLIKEMKEILPSDIKGKQQQNEMKSSSQFHLKSFTYQIIEANSIKQQEHCAAVAINKDCSIVATGCNKLIKIYEFQQGMLKLNQVLNEHQSEVSTLNFMKQSNQLISGGCGSILIWQYNNNSWICSQTIKGHSQYIRCIILNNNEDLFISSSDDKTIKFWVKTKKEWICQQTISDHYSQVYQLSLNEQQNQVISCGNDGFILVIEQLEPNKNWIVKQKIQVDCYGYRLCFINNNIFTFQPENGNLMYVYEMNNVNRQFTKSKDITLNQGNEGCWLFPQQFNKQKQLVVNKHDKYVHLIRFTENAEFKVEQSIQFGKNNIFGQLSDNGEYLITWDQASYEIQIRRFQEQ
ncbi:unnamed protein product [Paramecium primaurelia]|uniref:WD domain, G-beta repeat protein n=1 Tax=Paramecium primaurelia TaxID=5886 RepID=A0A8S1MXY7_PARPR|nr:unnamed protein product [Paramecium primaurelia]